MPYYSRPTRYVKRTYQEATSRRWNLNRRDDAAMAERRRKIQQSQQSQDKAAE